MALALIAGCVVATPVPASASPAWSIAPTTRPPGQPDGVLAGVSCPSATACFGVGFASSYPDITNGLVGGSFHDSALLERWDGTRWSPQPGPQATGDSFLNGVACTSTTSCVAVGSSSVGAGASTLAEHWDGTRWSVEPTVDPSGFAELLGIWCSSGSSCVAVGHVGVTGGTATLVEQWDGTSWSVVASPSPSGAVRSELKAVDCESSTSCVAVGDSETSSSQVSLVESWDGTAWTIVPSPNPSGATYARLSGVACPAAGDCIAVGGSSLSEALVEQWDGSSWSLVSTHQFPLQGVSLDAVDCLSATNCFAVGAHGGNSSLVERWNGGGWTVMTSPNPSGTAGTTLDAVDCPSTTSCHAVGDFEGFDFTTLSEQWNGASWSIDGTPRGSSQSEFVDVACPKSQNCFAVGHHRVGSVTRALIEHWNGPERALMPTPNRAGAVYTALSGVACASVTSCLAVGASTDTSTVTAVAERWNGTGWSMMSSPTLGGRDNQLHDLSCPTPTSCYAVGDYTDSPLVLTLVEHWNGSTWSKVPSPSSALYTGSTLQSISCPSDTDCVAVGSAGGVDRLVERWNGVNWSIVSVPFPSGAASVSLEGVSCSTTTSCDVVGASATAADTVTPLAMHWDGVHWTLEPAPTPAGAGRGELFGVVCPGGTSCLAVGESESTDGSTSASLVEVWNGAAWSIVPSPNPLAAVRAELFGIACTTSTMCWATGSSTVNGGRYALTEHYG